MGFRSSWIARRGTSTTELLTQTGFAPTGERWEYSDVGVQLVVIPEGERGPWSILVASGTQHFTEIRDEDARAVSRSSEALFFWCSDTTMATELSCWRDGRPAWRIAYSCEIGEPQQDGDVPPEAEAILERLRAAQAKRDGADHLYELTAEVGRSLTGFRHDQDVVTGEPSPYRVLAR